MTPGENIFSDEERAAADSASIKQEVRLMVVGHLEKPAHGPMSITTNVFPAGEALNDAIAQMVMLGALNSVASRSIKLDFENGSKVDRITYAHGLVIKKKIHEIYLEIGMNDGEDLVKKMLEQLK
jgi:hypothetical protein